MSKRILVVSTSFPGLTPASSGLGGAPFIYREVKALVCAGYSAVVIMPALAGAPATEQVDGVTLYRVRYPLMSKNPGYNGMPQHGRLSITQKISQFFMALALVFRVATEITKGNYNLLWSNWLQLGFLCSIANFWRLPHLVSIRGSDVRESSDLVVRLMAKFSPNILNMYPDDNEISGWVTKFSFNNWKVPAVYEPKDIKIQKGPFVITVIGRFDGEESSLFLKGLGVTVFEVLAKLLDLRTDFSVVVVGDGMKLPEYQDMLGKFGHRIRYTGWQANFDDELSVASLVVGGSGMNGVIMDSVPNAIPVMISKNLTGSLWRDKENCLIFDPDNSEQWLNVFLWALENSNELKEFSCRAKEDLKRFAQPVEQAGVRWDRVITEFCTSVKKR